MAGLAKPDSKEVDLHINTTKTKLITFNIPYLSPHIDEEDIENFGDFQYLGSYIASNRKKQRPERESMDYLLKIASYLEVSCITLTKGATV